MRTPHRRNTPTARQVLAQIKRLERYLNNLRMIPATEVYRTKIILPLFSKALTVGRAICLLVQQDFPAEAFGLSRTLVDIFFCVRYMTNRDTEARITTYIEYMGRVHQEWGTIIAKYFPNTKVELPSSHEELMDFAKKYPSKHLWTGHGGQARLMALEEDTVETDDKGKPLKSEFDYDVIYFWTSQYVHVTINALLGHATGRGEVFRVRADSSHEKYLAVHALSNTLAFISKIFVHGLRTMNEDQPRALHDMHKLLVRFGRRKKKSAKP